MYDRDALLAAIDLQALADEFLGPGRSTSRARMWPCPNPHHAQTGRTPPVSIFTSRRGEQRWRCHGCGDGGTAIDLVLACQGGTPRDAITFLAQRAGHHQHDLDRRPARRPTHATPVPQVGCRDPDRLDRYVRECAERLWQPDGRGLLRWLTDERRLPDDVLVKNRVGADLGPRLQSRPDGMPCAAGVVLPVINDGRPVYAQLRIQHPRPDLPRYLNPTADLAANPRVARIRPVTAQHAEVLVTEGTIDALSAAAAGYRAVAVLSAAYGDEAVAVALAAMPHRLVLAFDADPAGRGGADRLAALLDARQRTPVVLDLGCGDLNENMRDSDDWAQDLRSIVDDALYQQSRSAGCALSR